MSEEVFNRLREALKNNELRYTKEYKPVIKDIDIEKGEITVYTSVAVEDRDGEIIEPKEFRLDNYKKHSVFIADHRYSIENIIGKCTDIGVDEKGLWQHLKYFIDYDGPKGDLAKWSFYLARNGLAAFSIGFIPHKPSVFDPDEQVRKLRDVELLEVSQVAVPANQDAVLSYAKSYEGKLPEQVKKLINKESEMEQIDKINERLDKIEQQMKDYEEKVAMLEKKAKDQIEINKRLSTNSVIAEKNVDDVWEEVINKLKKGEENG